MKVLFLDIDGVLNRDGTKERCNGYIGVDRFLCNKFLKWLRTTDVKIVLSSTWRLHSDMWQHLEDAGIKWIDITPDMARRQLSGIYAAPGRGTEIQTWLDNHPEVTQWAILDDMNEFHPEQLGAFVQTQDGIEDHHIEQLKEIFA